MLDSSGCLWMLLPPAPADPVSLPPAGDGTKTSRTTTMESSYLKRSDSKSFPCAFPVASSGISPKALLPLSHLCLWYGQSPPPAWHCFPWLLPKASLFLSLQVAIAHLFKQNHPTAPLPRRQAGKRWCLPGISPKQSLSASCLHKFSLPSLQCPCAGMSPKPPPGPWGTHTLSSSRHRSLHGHGDVCT